MVLYDKETDGVVSVKFQDPEAARNCVKVCILAQMSFGDKKLLVWIVLTIVLCSSWMAGTSLGPALRLTSPMDEEEKQRLDEFGTWLESSHTVENTAK